MKGGYIDIEDDPCQQTCRLKEAIVCRGREKDCAQYGGYNFDDPCKQTCNSVDPVCEGPPVDCRMFQGYDARDACKQTCKSKERTICPANFVDCRQLGGYDPNDPCQQKCKKRCPERFVDCSDKGGYDLQKDICKQECNMQISQTELFGQIELCFRLWKGEHLTLAETMKFFQIAMGAQGLGGQ